jgi:hypothetical protein
MESKLFRKSALDRISSPEQLNDYMKVAGPGVWCILAGITVTFAAFFVWGIMGSIPETAEIKGTMLSPMGNSLAVYCYLTIDETKQLKADMNARISPDYAPKEQFGYIYGTVKSVGSSPVTVEYLRTALGDDFEFISLPSGNVIEIVVELQTQNGKLRWSTHKGSDVDVILGSTCAVTVITAERKPYELMFR